MASVAQVSCSLGRLTDRLVPDKVDRAEHGLGFSPRRISKVGCIALRAKTPCRWAIKIGMRLFDV